MEGGRPHLTRPPATPGKIVPTEDVLGSNPKRLVGTDDATIDEKGRILISVKKRERLQPNFAIALGDNGCLYAYPGSKWEEIMEKVLSYDPTNQGRQEYTRLVFGNSEDELNWDQQGRVVIPRKFRELAKLKEKVKLVGCGDRLEIWAEEEYALYQSDPDNYGKQRRDAIRDAWMDMKIL